MSLVRRAFVLLALGVVLALAALPALAHSGAQNPNNVPNVFTPEHDHGDSGGDQVSLRN